MGSGIAKLVKEKWYTAYMEYKLGSKSLGCYTLVNVGEGAVYCKWHYAH